MSVYAIHTGSKIHNKFKKLFLEKNNFDEAVEVARELSFNIMDSYSDIHENFEKKTKEWCDYFGYDVNESEYTEYLGKLYEENVEYEIRRMVEDFPYTADEANEMYGCFNFLVEKFGDIVSVHTYAKGEEYI